MANDVTDWFTNKRYNQPDQGIAGAVGEGIGSLYFGNQVADSAQRNAAILQQQQDTLANMYGPNSPYTAQLRQELARKDAKAGRNSQYGTREVELQARLAGLQGQNAQHIAQLAQQQQASQLAASQVRAQQLAHLFNIADKTGATGWVNNKLGDMFNPPAVNQPMSQSPYAGGGDYSTWSPGQTYNPETPYQSNAGMGQMYGPTDQYVNPDNLQTYNSKDTGTDYWLDNQ